MGGNVVFGDKSADRIDLTKLPRKDVVKTITGAMQKFNDGFKKRTGFPLWKDDFTHYLSGSTDAMFNTTIPDDDFVRVKPSVGDIDTQVNGMHAAEIEQYLDACIGKKMGDMTLINYKKSVDQYITLWSSSKYGINIQIDLELVDFLSNGRPTPWSRFSHSSAWEDMQIGIKGIAHKYVFRALTANSLHKVIIRPKTARGKEKEVLSSVDAFSPKGYRTKLRPALDEKGKHIFKNGVPVYDELAVAETGTITDLEVIFSSFFHRDPKDKDIEKMHSYLGVLDLIKAYADKSKFGIIADGMANLLFGARAQKMYRDDDDRDHKEKRIIMEAMANKLGLKMSRWDSLIRDYYKKG